MCGFSGLAQKAWDSRLTSSFVAASRKALARRGPDGFNAERIEERLLFTHARLSIIDLEGGSQPMADEDGAIVFNGEIYNYRELRDPALPYRTHSDTEVLLKGVNRRGTEYLGGVDGMFAFAHYDPAKRRLTLARDLFGIKPLYYFADSECIAFASCLQPLMLLSKGEIDRTALAQYYLSRACRGSRTIFSDIVEVRPGEAVVFDLATFAVVSRGRWAAPVHAARDLHDEQAALDALDAAMNLAVERHLVADVPVASFLSGGIDSSLITALAARRRPDLSAFSIGFQDKDYDESPYAAALARQYRIRHHVRFCDATEFMTYLREWPLVMDDVVADPSAVMLYVVAQFARDMGYKVVLSGDGADELFAGYNQYYRFQLARAIHPYLRRAPAAVDVVRRLKPDQSRYEHFVRQAALAPLYYGTGMIFEPHLIGDLLRDGPPEWDPRPDLAGALDLDLDHRLPDDMLTRTDRATMHASVEARVPFLTRYVGEVAWSLPEDMLIRGRTRKYLLKTLAGRYVPRECIERPKVGFDLPLARWFREDLRELVADTLADTWQDEFLAKGAMEKVVSDHLSGRNDNADKIWAFLLLDGNVRALREAAREADDTLPSPFADGIPADGIPLAANLN